MVKHIVFWKLKDEAGGKPAKDNLVQMIALLNNLQDSVPQVVECEAGANYNPDSAAWDVALYSVFHTREDLDAYQVHPEHLKVKDFIVSVAQQRAVVDYEI